MARRESGSTLEGVTKGDGRPPDDPAAQGAAQRPVETPVLPEAKTGPRGTLEGKTIFIYGPPKIGKSTYVSEFFGGEVFFFDTENGLTELSVYRAPVGDWNDFRRWGLSIVENPGRYKAVAIDTFDMLVTFCRAYVNQRAGIQHESDAEWGKGWDMVRQELTRPIARLAAIDGLTLILVSHSQEVEIKTRTQVISKSVPALSKAAGQLAANMADLELFCDYDEVDGESVRVVRTKGSTYWEAGERGNPPRLPDTLPMTWDALAAAWEKGSK